MFLLEVVVAGAPLIGLLGTVTGLIEVFSQMPAGSTVDKSLSGHFTRLTHYNGGTCHRLANLTLQLLLAKNLDKRATALEWLIARLIEATDRKGRPPPQVIR